jgi:hypothetical protein
VETAGKVETAGDEEWPREDKMSGEETAPPDLRMLQSWIQAETDGRKRRKGTATEEKGVIGGSNCETSTMMFSFCTVTLTNLVHAYTSSSISIRITLLREKESRS